MEQKLFWIQVGVENWWDGVSEGSGRVGDCWWWRRGTAGCAWIG